MPFCRFRIAISSLAPVVLSALLSGIAHAAPPAAPAASGTANSRAVSLRMRAVSATALTVASASGTRGSVSLLATVDGKGLAPAGSVVFTVQGKRFAEVPVANGTASLTVQTLPTGLSSLSASYQGDGNLLPSTSATIRFYQDDQD